MRERIVVIYLHTHTRTHMPSIDVRAKPRDENTLKTQYRETRERAPAAAASSSVRETAAQICRMHIFDLLPVVAVADDQQQRATTRKMVASSCVCVCVCEHVRAALATSTFSIRFTSAGRVCGWMRRT